MVKGIFGSLRGYAGNISAAGALDAVSNDGNTLIIDIRCSSLYSKSHLYPTPGAFKTFSLLGQSQVLSSWFK